MAERDGYIPGVPCWVDTSQPDPDAAAAFYSGLFAWEVEDLMPPGSQGKYLVARLHGGDVAAISTPPEGATGPAAWNTYVWVDSADETTSRVRQAGGTVVMEPFDVFEAGRMATCTDTEGATFWVWQAKEHRGARIVNEPGALTLNQLTTSDPERAQEFYSGVFGWRFEKVPGDMPYWGIYNGDRLNGGMMPLAAEGGVPSHWLVYFGSEGVDDDAGRIGELGGTVMVAPMPVPGGRILVAQDPQGAVVALLSGRFDD